MAKAKPTLRWNISKNKPDNQYAFVKSEVEGEKDKCCTVFKRKDGQYGWVYNDVFSEDTFEKQDEAKLAFEKFIEDDTITDEEVPHEYDYDVTTEDDIPF
jgi:hypothetical protein